MAEKDTTKPNGDAPIFLFPKFDQDDYYYYYRLLQTTEFFLARPVVEASLQDGLIIRQFLVEQLFNKYCDY